MNVAALGTELINRSTWYPTILGVLVVVAGVVLFCGSIYLLLGTNMGARLGFLVAFTALMAFMVVLTTLWITTASPLNTLRGKVPQWTVKAVVDDISTARVAALDDVAGKKFREVDTIEAANVKAAVDEALVKKVDTAIEHFTAEDNKFARYDAVTNYLVVSTKEAGGSNPSFLNFEFTHQPKVAIVKFCGVIDPTTLVPFGVAPPAPTCAPAGTPQAKTSGYVVLERDLGSVRLPPIVAWISSIILFVLGLLGLSWYEKDQKAISARLAARRRSGAEVPARVPARA